MSPDSTTNPFDPINVISSSGESIQIRLLEPSDAPKLLDYFTGLSAQTRQYFGPHPFDSETVNTICNTLDPKECARIVALSPEHERILAYVLVSSGATPADVVRYKSLGIDINAETDCSLAPSIADAYQSQRLGNFLMEKALAVAKGMLKKRVILWGGVQARNERAVRYYRKYGFVELGQFETDVLNYDMYLSLE
ncbi:GNAT family N-acetyltransferase [Spirosoma sp. KCTC 42546]|uniref:GNAT family N-acetyltransferase n=1 Tax=Spirosoma sp. KCTC 42546 TaxID=2520506 RepID=UPI001157E8FD|nr:GNAT family N-acetyltransferase [Spirosoma sp. KCTC 42546]QDK78439.1 GNAT family N-acetyltransferase [Spirosoma sp. KCTC 42546]